jgi:D-arabinitol dehydrogenase (NADP+)
MEREKMKSLVIPEPDKTEVQSVPIPEPPEKELLIKIMACGICGTDIHIFRGEYFGDYPVVPGHEFSGIVEKIGQGVRRFKEGERVSVEPNISCDNCHSCLNNRQNFCLNWEAVGVTRPGGMAQYVCAPEKNVFSIGNLSFESAAFMEPLSCVLHGIERAEITLADKIAILGAGPIGLLMLKIIKNMGSTEVTVVDRNRSRVEYSKKIGADNIFYSTDELEKDYYDVVIDATGALSVMAGSIDHARHGGTILLFGVPPSGKTIEIEPFKIFKKGLKLLSSYTSLRNSYQAVDLLKSGIVDVSDLISHRIPLENFEKGVEMIEQGKENVKKVMILPNP